MVALHFALEHTAGQDVCRLNRGEILFGEGFPHPRKQPVGVTQTGPVQRIANRSRIGEERQLPPARDVVGERRLGLSTELVVLGLEEQACNRHQLVVAVIGEIEMVGHP